MYRVPLKTAVVEALRQSLLTSLDPEWGGVRPGTSEPRVHVGIEYPLEPQHYPGMWVQYDDRENLHIVGINHREFVADTVDLDLMHEVTRWEFSGTITVTLVALTSMERDRLFDEMVRIYAFSGIESNQAAFRQIIEGHDLIGITLNWDELRPFGDVASPGTPWGTEDEVIYEQSVSFDVVVGQFRSAPSANALVPLSAVLVEATELGSDGQPVQVLTTTVDEDSPSLWGPPV